MRSSMCTRILMRDSTANLGLCGSASVWRQRAYQIGRGFYSSEEQKHLAFCQPLQYTYRTLRRNYKGCT
jgi:hypothetical protein